MYAKHTVSYMSSPLFPIFTSWLLHKFTFVIYILFLLDVVRLENIELLGGRKRGKSKIKCFKEQVRLYWK